MARKGGDFNLRCVNEKLSEYDPLRDRNLQHFFENRNVQQHLLANGLIDGNGRVINLDKNKSKLHIIQQEFRAAERQEALRRKEEEEFRHRVQQKRLDTLEKIKRQERLNKIKEDHAIRSQIMQASRSALNIPGLTPVPKGARKAKCAVTSCSADSTGTGMDPRASTSEQSFFVTDERSKEVDQ